MEREVPTINFAHRGLHNHLFPENSLAAFKNAMDKGYGIELDVHMLASGEIVVFHDDTTTRMTGKENYISALSKSDLKDYYLRKSTHTIPLLTDVLQLVKGKVPILLEIKNEGKVGELEDAVAKTLSVYNGKILIQSFNPFTLHHFYKYYPTYLRGQLSCYFTGYKMNSVKKWMLKNLKLNHISKPDFISYYIHNINSPILKKVKLPIFAWTVQSDAEVAKAIKVCSNIIFEGIEPPIANKHKFSV